MRKLLFVFFTIVLISNLGWAWGHDGHCIVANVAEDHLTDATKNSLHLLIGYEHLCAMSSWPDEITRERPETKPWHYVDIPMAESDYVFDRDCTNPKPGDCVVAKIEDFVALLRNPAATPETRLEALKFVVHFIGDIHQPMHAVKEARGGNDIKVRMFGNPLCGSYDCNLHSAWDSGLILHRHLDDRAYADLLEQEIARDHLQASAAERPEQWAVESLQLAKSVWVENGTDLDEAYYARNISMLDRRLALAGLRLAAVLNRVLGNPSADVSSATVAPALLESPDKVVNLGSVKRLLKSYYACTCECGCYTKDVEDQSKRAIEYLRKQAAERHPDEHLGLVLDIDDTALWNYPYYSTTDFGYVPKPYDTWVAKADAPAILPTLKIFTTARELGIAVFFISGRHEDQRSATERNLKAAGYDGWKKLILRKPADMGKSAAEFKSAARQGLVRDGYHLVLNVGDQTSDLEGSAPADLSVKLPNPMYQIP